MNKPQQRNNQALKYISLITLTLQNAIVGLSMRYARTRSGDMFLSSTAVVMAEVVKLVTCLILVLLEEGNLQKFFYSLESSIVKQPIDTLKVCVPSLLYIIQNNLLYVSASNLDAATYQVTYQLKILTTAFFAVVILKRSLRNTQWGALVLLIIGVVLVQLAQSSETTLPSGIEQNHLIGFSAALSACFLSGFAGVYFEKILKDSNKSVWMRNVQLSLLSLPFGLMTCFINDGATLKKQGFFFGYDLFVYYLVVLQAGGGLIVAMVVKYADNILKGAVLVICSIFMYGYQPKSTFTDTHSPTNKDTTKEQSPTICLVYSCSLHSKEEVGNLLLSCVQLPGPKVCGGRCFSTHFPLTEGNQCFMRLFNNYKQNNMIDLKKFILQYDKI
ncbi:UDP-N-acetylglucosamine transporter isoform X2 [Osmia bicornis bicornis]|uniref:UDP-N-acetylglucosamine transporter isoform X2 n=1 Tax=Osmia bicornis bicornis TaxID=1437191 RepID=UPI0010F58F23|nr:UDP-N-acetylglucosamine transporter isoform X2 [Osmia bicornis bicornis]